MKVEAEMPRIRLDALTGLRGVAAYAVLVAHAVDSTFNAGGISVFHDFASRLAYFGIALFFVLSGFVMQYNYGPLFRANKLGAATRQFVRARFARLYPLYAISVICYIMAVSLPTSWEDILLFLAYATMTQSWFNMEMAVFPPAWSISTEAFFYLTFIPLTLLLRRLPAPAWALMVFCVAATIGTSTLFFFFKAPLVAFIEQLSWLNGKGSANAWAWVVYFAPYIRVLEFICGMLAAQTYLWLQTSPRTPVLARVASAGGLLWCGFVVFFGQLLEGNPVGSILSNFIFASALAPILIDCARQESTLSRLLSSRLLVFVGEISLSVYVFSFYVIMIFAGRLAPGAAFGGVDVNSVVKVGMIVALTTVFAYGSYSLIEVPSRAWLLRVLGRPDVPRPIPQGARSLQVDSI